VKRRDDSDTILAAHDLQARGYRAGNLGPVTLATRQNRLNLPLGENAPDEINVIVEIPSGSRNKYEYDKTLDIFRLDRALHSPIFYPGDTVSCRARSRSTTIRSTC
jgi:hypothetical protein